MTFDSVEVHKAGTGSGEGGGWMSVNITDIAENATALQPGEKSFDLLALKSANLTALLAEQPIATGNYTQLRVNVTEVLVVYKDLDENGEPIGDPKEVSAELPSGILKFVRPFEIVGGEVTTLLLDIDADKSLTFTGATKEGEPSIIVKPVVKLEVTHGNEASSEQEETELEVTNSEENESEQEEGDTSELEEESAELELEIDDSTANSLDLSWNMVDVAEFDHYNVYRSNDEGVALEESNLIASIDTITTTSYTDTDVTAEEEYFYIVTVVDESDNILLQSEEESDTPSSE